MSEQQADKKTYEGGCHCGAVRYSVTTALDSMGECNCSRCKRLGWVMQSAPASDFVLHSGADKLTHYAFNTNKIDHSFCSVCGIESFSRGSDGKGNEMVMVNVNCLDGVPPVDRSTIKHWDGASW